MMVDVGSHYSGRRLVVATCALIALLACLLGCHSSDQPANADDLPTCATSGTLGPFGFALSSELPRGACNSRSSDCQLQTRDPCRDGSRGPWVQYRCTCGQNETWQ